MPRNDGVDRTLARNIDIKTPDLARIQAHNERQNDIYSNRDIVTEVSHRNVHYKQPDTGYQAIFDRLIQEKVISTRGLKEGAIHFCELLFDVNSAYFHNHGGYEFAKQFYADAYKAAVEIVGGEQYIVSAVMHTDERNTAMSDALGYDVFHYHLHVVYIPVVEKQILWTKRCKDPALVGTVKETIMQVSRSKKWDSPVTVDDNGKKKCIKSYSLLQDHFYEAMRAAGYNDIQRGQKGSTEEHLTITQFKVQAEKERLQEVLMEQEAVEMQIDALTDTKADIERQTQEAQNVLNDILPDLEQIEQLEKEFPANAETILPHPKAFESAKSYRERIKPIWEGFVRKIRSFLNTILQLKREVRQLRSDVWNLRSRNQDLQYKNDQLHQENQDLRKIARDFDRAKKVLGKETVDQAVATATEQESSTTKSKRSSKEYSR